MKAKKAGFDNVLWLQFNGHGQINLNKSIFRYNQWKNIQLFTFTISGNSPHTLGQREWTNCDQKSDEVLIWTQLNYKITMMIIKACTWGWQLYNAYRTKLHQRMAGKVKYFQGFKFYKSKILIILLQLSFNIRMFCLIKSFKKMIIHNIYILKINSN